MIELSIVIVTWNSAEVIDACLSSIPIGAERYRFEIIVVDNNSTDQTVEIVGRRFPGVQLKKNGDNLGFARANNLAIKEAAGRIVLLLNPDTIVQRNALDLMVEYLDGHSKVGAIGPRLVKSDGSTQPSCLRTPSMKSQLIGYAKGGRYALKDDSKPTEVEAVSGAALMVKRQAIEKVGCLDEDYFMYAEDVDWCYRIRKAGWEIHYFPLAAITHLGSSSARKVPVQTYVRYRISRLLFVRKHRPNYEYKLVRLLIYTNIKFRKLKAAGDTCQFYRDVLKLYRREIEVLENRLRIQNISEPNDIRGGK